MRFFFSGPRVLGIRSGISFGPEDFKTSSTPQRSAGGQASGAFAYVVKGDHNLVKIGVSTNPNARLAQLKTASAFPIDLAYVCAVQGDASGAFAVEKLAHKILARHQTNGEWFDVEVEMAVAAIAAASHKAGRKIVEIPRGRIDEVIRLAALPDEQARRVIAGAPQRSMSATIGALAIKGVGGLAASLLIAFGVFVLYAASHI